MNLLSCERTVTKPLQRLASVESAVRRCATSPSHPHVSFILVENKGTGTQTALMFIVNQPKFKISISILLGLGTSTGTTVHLEFPTTSASSTVAYQSFGRAEAEVLEHVARDLTPVSTVTTYMYIYIYIHMYTYT